jgi:arsenate reductase
VKAIGVSPREILRTKDPAYEELGLASGKHNDAQLLELMVSHPGLIQRPIVLRGKKAVVARPIERIEALLK